QSHVLGANHDLYRSFRGKRRGGFDIAPAGADIAQTATVGDVTAQTVQLRPEMASVTGLDATICRRYSQQAKPGREVCGWLRFGLLRNNWAWFTDLGLYRNIGLQPITQ